MSSSVYSCGQLTNCFGSGDWLVLTAFAYSWRLGVSDRQSRFGVGYVGTLSRLCEGLEGCAKHFLVVVTSGNVLEGPSAYLFAKVAVTTQSFHVTEPAIVTGSSDSICKLCCKWTLLLSVTTGRTYVHICPVTSMPSSRPARQHQGITRCQTHVTVIAGFSVLHADQAVTTG